METTTALPFRAGTVRNRKQTLRLRLTKRLDPAVFYTLLALFALVAIPYGTVEQWWIALFECVVFSLAAIWIVEGALTGTWRIRNVRMYVPLTGLLLLALVQILPIWSGGLDAHGLPLRLAISADPYQTYLWILQFGAIVLAALLIQRFTSNLKRLGLLTHVIIAIGLASAVFGITRHALNLQFPLSDTPGLAPDGGYGQFINRNHFALLMEMSLGLTLGLVAGGAIPRKRLSLYLVAAGILWVALVLTNSRGGIISMIGQFIMLAVLWTLSRRRIESQNSGRHVHTGIRRNLGKLAVRLSIAGCLIAVMTAGVVWVGGDSLIHRMKIAPRELKVETPSRDNSSRLSIWRTTLLMIRDKPLTGIGFGGYFKAVTEYHDASGRWSPQEAHNDYLELVASGGIIALAFGIWFAVMFIRRARLRFQLSENTFRRSACLGALVALSGVAFHSLVDFGLHITVNALVCAALVVIATANIPANDRVASN